MNDDGALAALVERTAGPQPWRKAFHATNAVLIATAIVLLDPSWSVGVAALTAIVLIAIAVDAARLTNPRANQLVFRYFAKLASPREARGVASSTWYMAGILA